MWIKKIKALDAHEHFSLNSLATSTPLFKLKYKKKNKHLNIKFVYLCDDIRRQVIFILI